VYPAIFNRNHVLLLDCAEVKLKCGENGCELVDKLEALFRRFSEDGDWVFSWSIEGIVPSDLPDHFVSGVGTKSG